MPPGPSEGGDHHKLVLGLEDPNRHKPVTPAAAPGKIHFRTSNSFTTAGCVAVGPPFPERKIPRVAERTSPKNGQEGINMNTRGDAGPTSVGNAQVNVQPPRCKLGQSGCVPKYWSIRPGRP